ncbi:MAG: TolC family protein, partial [Pseudomonadota bacterium]
MKQFVRSVVVALCVALPAGAFFAGSAYAQNDSIQQNRGIRLNGPLGALFGRSALPKPAPIVQQAIRTPQIIPEAAPAKAREDINDYEIPQPLPRPPNYVLNSEQPSSELPAIDGTEKEAPQLVPASQPAPATPEPEKQKPAEPQKKIYPVKVKVASADDSVFTMPTAGDFGMMVPDMPRDVMRAPLVGNSFFMPRIEVASLTPTVDSFGMPFPMRHDDDDDVDQPQAVAVPPPPQPENNSAAADQKQAEPPPWQAEIKTTPVKEKSGADPPKIDVKTDAEDKSSIEDLKPAKLAAEDDIPVALASPVVNVRHKPRFSIPRGESMTLEEAVSRSISLHPEIGMARARTLQAKAGVRVANSSMLPQVDARLTYGEGNDLGSGSTVSNVNQTAGAVTLRQILFDFGATKYDINRSNYLLDSERFRVLDKVEDVALRTAEAYVKVLEERKLLVLADDYLAAHERLAQLVRLNQNNGNGTIADVSRINSRVLEAHTILTSLEADLENATDQLQRLVHTSPGQLGTPPLLKGATPPDIENALNIIDRSHPRLLSINASSASMDADVRSKRMQFLPKVSAEVQGDWVDYSDPVGTSDSNVRGLVVVRQKIFDGFARNG